MYFACLVSLGLLPRSFHCDEFQHVLNSASVAFPTHNHDLRKTAFKTLMYKTLKTNFDANLESTSDGASEKFSKLSN